MNSGDEQQQHDPEEEQDIFSSHSSNSRQSDRRSQINSGRSDRYQQSDTVVERTTPVLFSTNRGLHLRLAKPANATVSSSTSRRLQSQSASAYDIRFCDLERWTNRANSFCLEDTIASRTFTISQQPLTQRGGLFPSNLRTRCSSFNC